MKMMGERMPIFEQYLGYEPFSVEYNIKEVKGEIYVIYEKESK